MNILEEINAIEKLLEKILAPTPSEPYISADEIEKNDRRTEKVLFKIRQIQTLLEENEKAGQNKRSEI